MLFPWGGGGGLYFIFFIICIILFFSVINKPTKKTKTKATVTNHVQTNDFLNTDSSMSIVKSDISDHFRIFLVTSAQIFNNIHNKTTIRKMETNEKSKHYFMNILNEIC